MHSIQLSWALSALVGLARITCVLMGTLALFGSLFFGAVNFNTLAGVCMIAVAFIPLANAALLFRLSVAGLLLTLGSVIQYYAFHHFPGNDYAWGFKAPGIAALTIMAIVSGLPAFANWQRATGERYARSAAALFSLPLLVLAVENLQASTGRGGAFSFVISAIAGVSVAVLLWLVISGLPADRLARSCSQAHLTAAGVAALGYTGLRAARFAYPESNLLGGWALIFGPLLWVGMAGLAVAALPCVVIRFMRGN